MEGIYSLIIGILNLSIRTASFFNEKARLWVNGRKNWEQQLRKKFELNTSPVIWFHCASLGEFEQGKPVMEKMIELFPHHKLLVTFYSPSGYEIRKNYEKAFHTMYLPIDTKDNARKLISITRPSVVLFVKYEFWHFYIKEANQNNIPCICFSAAFRRDQLFFKPYGKFYLNILKMFHKIYVQNFSSVELLKHHGIKDAEFAGDTRFDRVKETAANQKEFPLIKEFCQSKPVFIAGSVWPEDMEVIISYINNYGKHFKFIIAPHEIKQKEIDEYIARINTTCTKYSIGKISSEDVLFIDNIGILSHIYRFGRFSFIGGAFKQGLHNILEAATFGLPVFFGPEYKKFPEAGDLISLNAAFSVNNAEEMNSIIYKINTPERLTEIRKVCKKYIDENAGATEKIIQYCNEILSQKSGEKWKD
ncbi:MAG: 3-deoxy-D-manno-octulosonic acid transferase [Cytophagaceae bacterium]